MVTNGMQGMGGCGGWSGSDASGASGSDGTYRSLQGALAPIGARWNHELLQDLPVIHVIRFAKKLWVIHRSNGCVA